jgi:beta-glucosidase
MTDMAKLVAELTLDEKAALTAGVDMWSTASVPRLGIPAARRAQLGGHRPRAARGNHRLTGTATPVRWRHG